MRSVLRRHLRIFLIAQKEKRGGSKDADDEHHLIIADEVGVAHQCDAEQHRFPEIHPLPVDETDETDRAKDKSANQVDRAEIEHLDVGQLEAGHSNLTIDHL